MSTRTGLIIAVVVLFGTLCAVTTWALMWNPSKASVVQQVATTEADPTPAPREKTLLEQLDEMSFWPAFEATRGEMTDTYNNESPGVAAFALWAASHMRWSDVAVSTDETTNALAQKDSDAARGKRLCTSGTIGQIVVQKDVAPKHLAVGQFLIDSGAFYHFYAVQSTGALVNGSYARFCGIVTGLYTFDNLASGQTISVAIVGMFDLPENKAVRTQPVRAVAPTVAPHRPSAVGPSPLRY